MTERLLLDPAVLAVRFGGALRAAGVPATAERAAAFTRALTLVPPDDRTRLYWTARLAYVSGREQIAPFDAVFAAVFGGETDVADGGRNPDPPVSTGTLTTRPAPPALPWATRPPSVAPRAQPAEPQGRPAEAGPPPADALQGDGPGREVLVATASPQERLRETAFADLGPEELADLQRLVGRLALAPPPRRTRRARPDPAGERLDLRRTLRRAQRTAGDPLRLARRRRRLRPRRLVLLCDVSGSMAPYTRAFLTLLQAAVAGAAAEAFVFATRLTRLTRALEGRDPDAALARAAQRAPDWSGGTRLGPSLRSLVREHAERVRGAVVLILSDGWEPEDPALVAEQMARLARLAHRVVWVNPRRAAEGYAPLTGGMAAALPFVDAFVSGHNLAALDEVVAAVAGEEPRWNSTARSR